MNNTIQQLKEEIMDGLTKNYGYLPAFYMISADVSNALDKVIKATADAMVKIVEEHRINPEPMAEGSDVDCCMLMNGRTIAWILTRIAEEKALRDEITQ